MGGAGEIVHIDPAAALPGGEVLIECRAYDTSSLNECQVLFGEMRARLVGASPARVLALVPEEYEEGGQLEVTLESGDGARTAPAQITIGEKLALDLHNVANPAFDPDDGALWVMRSGSRGQKELVSLFRITTDGHVVDVNGEIVNPTGLAFDQNGQLFVTSRNDGALYVTGPTVSSFDAVMRIDEHGDAEIFYRGLGRPGGLAFDTAGNLYVAASLRGRRGVVRISPDGRAATLVVAGMNVIGLAFSADGRMAVVTNDSAYNLPLGIRGTLLR